MLCERIRAFGDEFTCSNCKVCYNEDDRDCDADDYGQDILKNFCSDCRVVIFLCSDCLNKSGNDGCNLTFENRCNNTDYKIEKCGDVIYMVNEQNWLAF